MNFISTSHRVSSWLTRWTPTAIALRRTALPRDLDGSKGWVIYRATPDKLWKMFDGIRSRRAEGTRHGEDPRRFLRKWLPPVPWKSGASAPRKDAHEKRAFATNVTPPHPASARPAYSTRGRAALRRRVKIWKKGFCHRREPLHRHPEGLPTVPWKSGASAPRSMQMRKGLLPPT